VTAESLRRTERLFGEEEGVEDVVRASDMLSEPTRDEDRDPSEGLEGLEPK